MFMIMFWAFRVIVAITGQMDVAFAVKPYDNMAEVIILFAILVLIPFIFKKFPLILFYNFRFTVLHFNIYFILVTEFDNK